MNWRHLTAVLLFGCLLISIVGVTRPLLIPDPRPIIMPVTVIEPLRAGMTESLIISPLFSTEELVQLILATTEIQTATRGVIQFHLVDMTHFQPTDDGLRDNRVYRSITIRPADATDPMVQSCDGGFLSGWQCVGYYDDGSHQHTTLGDVLVVPGRLSTLDEERVVMTHELLHSCGMEHLVDLDSVMYPDAEWMRRHVGERDLQQLCDHYRCDAEQLDPPATDSEGPLCLSTTYQLVNPVE